MKITDGTGRGFEACVTEENSLCVEAITEVIDRHQNVNHGTVWSLPFEGIDPAGANDYFFYLANIGTKDLAITDIRASTTVVGTLDVKHVSGTPTYVSETAVTPVSRNLGSSKTPSATINTDTDITTLTDEGILFFMDLDTTGKTYRLSTSSNIIIPQGQALALMWGAGTGILSGVVSLVEL